MTSNNNVCPNHPTPINFNEPGSYDEFTDFGEFPIGCKFSCVQKYIDHLEEEIRLRQTVAKVYKSIKVAEDGTVPPFEFSDIIAYYQCQPSIKNKNIQDLFNINLLELDLPGLKLFCEKDYYKDHYQEYYKGYYQYRYKDYYKNINL